MSKSLISLTASLLFALTGLASAGVIIADNPDAHARPAYRTGLIGANGNIVLGTGFSVSHDGTGEYTITYPAGVFKGCPIFMITPAGGPVPIANDYDYITCGNGGKVSMQIRIYNTSQTRIDNAFHFLVVPT